MKLKSYLRGLGLGMIVTTIILVVTFKAADHNMTDAEIISKAREMGMVETSLYANGSTTEEVTPDDVATKSPAQETTTGEKSGEGMLEQETTANEPESATTAKPESTTTAKPQETTSKREESTTTAKPQETTSKREESTTAKPESTTAAKPQETTSKQETTTTASKEIVLEFENITSADKASRILYEAGVIQDIDAFNDYLSDNGYARKVGEGTFTFTKGMSFEEIAKIITRSR
ncbi:MAG: hypothetical protein NC086_10290 [Alistipes sp.]|nr:hypothetical protein [Alistipes sp.]